MRIRPIIFLIPHLRPHDLQPQSAVMPCLCTSNTLSLFIRSLAQVDVVRGAPLHLYRLQSQKSTKRLFTSICLLRRQYETSNPSFLSTTSHFSLENQTSKTGDDGEVAFAELLPESIDSIAKELRPQRVPSQRPIHQRRSALVPTGKERRPGTTLRTTFRRSKVENTSFALHYSSPRAPVADKLPSSKRIPELKPDIGSLSEKLQRASKQDDWEQAPREQWQINKAALKAKFPEGWNPIKRLSPDALAGIRALHAQMPTVYTTSVLAENFQVSPEAIRRILKSKWSPDSEEETDRQRRWFNRGKKVYTIHAEKGQKPPKRWRQLGIGDGRPEWMLRKRARSALPALITTARRRETQYEEETGNLADRIL